MFEDKQRQSRSAQEEQREEEGEEGEEALLASVSPSAAAQLDHQCLMVYISTGSHQNGLQGHRGILRKVSLVCLDAKSKAAGPALLLKTLKTSSSLTFALLDAR